MATERLYQKDVYLREADLTVTEVREHKGKMRRKSVFSNGFLHFSM